MIKLAIWCIKEIFSVLYILWFDHFLDSWVEICQMFGLDFWKISKIKKFILKLTNLFDCHFVKKWFSDADLNILICYLRIHLNHHILLYRCPMNFSSNLQNVSIKISAEKTFW